MHVLVVTMRVKPADADQLIEITRENVRETLKEQGVVRFDLVQQQEDPGFFMLFEVYRQADDHARHRATLHSKRWNAAAAPLLMEPPTRAVYRSVYPKESGWA